MSQRTRHIASIDARPLSFLECDQVTFREAIDEVSVLVGFEQDGIVRNAFDALLEVGGQRDAVSMMIPQYWRYSSRRIRIGSYVGEVICCPGRQRYVHEATTESFALLGALALAFIPDGEPN